MRVINLQLLTNRMDQPIIKFRNINFYYNKDKPTEVHALKDINFEINKGDYAAFFGSSGSGKSTILYIMSGMDAPTSGEVNINERTLQSMSTEEIAVYRQTGIGIIFQNFNLIPSLSVVENVELPLSFLGVSRGERRDRALKLLERLEMGEFKNRYPGELSGGQQQRVGIARALANDPPIILADEPLGNLDSANANNVMQILKDLNEKDGKTVIMVTHESWSLRDVTKVFYVKDGAIIDSELKTLAPEKAETGEAALKKIYPGLLPADYRAKAMVGIILRGHPSNEVERLEEFTGKLIKRELSIKEFISILDKPYNEGGVGLWSAKAKKIAESIEDAIRESQMLDSLYRRLTDHPTASLREEIDSIYDWLITELKFHVSIEQRNKINEIIGERIRNIITKDAAVKILDLPQSKGGVGLKTRMAFKISDQLEALIGSDFKALGENDKIQTDKK